MSRPDKQTVGLTTARPPSRIRRDPVPAEEPKTLAGRGDYSSREREIMLGILGIVLFAVALNIIWFGFSAWWNS